MAPKSNAVESGSTGTLRIFRFEELPAELRESIYEHLLVCGTFSVCFRSLNGPTTVTAVDPNRRRAVPRRHAPPLGKHGAAILRTNKFIYNEALPTLYSKNVFAFNNSSAAGYFLSGRISPLISEKRTGEHIHHVSISSEARGHMADAMQAFRRLANLKTLIMEIDANDVYAAWAGKRVWNGPNGAVADALDFIDMSAPNADREAQLDKIAFACPGEPWEKDRYYEMSSAKVPARFKARLTELAGLGS